MVYQRDLVAAKLRRWENYLEGYRLPAWEDIPDFGLYMEQIIVLLKQFLDYMPPELKEEQFITASTINNYVRMKIMPGPDKKRYYRIHIAYLIIICSLKQGLSLALIQKVIPPNLSEEEVKQIYETFVLQHGMAAKFFDSQVRQVAGKILMHEDAPEYAVDSAEELIVKLAVVGSFSRLLAEKLLLLEGKQLQEGETVEEFLEKEAAEAERNLLKVSEDGKKHKKREARRNKEG